MKNNSFRVAERIDADDRVAFFELRGTPSRGRQGVVTVARVSGPRQPNTHHGREPELSGKRYELEWPCDSHAYDGFVDLETVLFILKKGSLRPPPGGIKDLTSGQFCDIRDGFADKGWL